MTLFFRHILNICFMLSVMIMAASCSGSSGVPQEPEDSSDIFLVCNVGMVGETRANPILPNEAMQTLRVIVVDGNGDVEINKYMDFNASYEQTSFIIGVSPGAKKTVYLFANEGAVGSITSDDNTVSISGSLHNYLDGLAVGNEDFEHVISKVYFTPDYSKGIPMNAIYEVNIPEGVKRVEKSMWLVRTACKFSFVFENARRDFDVTISNFEVRGLGDRQFLLPNFTGGIEPSFPGYSSWVDWLKDVSEKSEINPYDPTADQSGWLFRYDVPSTTRTVAFAYESSFTLPKIDSNGNPGSRTIQNRYVAESKQLKSGTTTYPAEQQYSLYISCSSNGVNKNFNVPLPNVRALFRNTHVVVTVSFSDGPIVINPALDVIPFS